VYYPAGTYVFNSTVTAKSNTKSIGDGIGASILKAGSGLALTASLIVNENTPVARVRQDVNISFEDMTIDGGGRTYISFPTAGFDTTGAMITLNGVDGADVMRVEGKNHQSNGLIQDLGCRNLRIRDSIFHDCGKDDFISSPVFSQAFGSTRKIVNISKANPAVVTIDVALASLDNGESVFIEGVQGLASIPDGDYVVGGVATNTFQLTGIDTTGDAGFADNQLAFVGTTGATTNWVPSENTTIAGCHFYDNLRSAISFMPAHGGIVSDCAFDNNGESTIFSERGSNIIITGNKFNKTTLTDITANAIEVNKCGNFQVVDNIISDTAADAIAIQGCVGGRVSGNILRDIITDNTIVYPEKPLAIAAGINGNTLDKTRGIFLSSLADSSLSNINITDNIIIDQRTTAQASGGIVISKAGTDDIVFDVDVKNNDFAASGLTSANMVKIFAAAVVLTHKINIKGNKGHSSEGMVVQQATVSSTGLVAFNVGFVPSMIQVDAIFLNATNQRWSSTYVVRDRTNITSGTLGIGQRVSADGLETSSTVNIDADNSIVTNDFYRITNGAGTGRAVAEFSSWLCDNTGIGVNMNVVTADDAIRLTLVFYP